MTVDIDRRTEKLSIDPPGDFVVGDGIDVVVDPQDPTYVLATTSQDGWEYSIWGELLIVGLIGAIPVALAWAGVPRRAATRAARKATGVIEATVVRADKKTAVLLVSGVEWIWFGDAYVFKGGRAHLVGKLTERAWLVLDNGKKSYWPRKPVLLGDGGDRALQ